MTEVILKRSSKAGEKYDAVSDGYSDFARHKDGERKQRYIARLGATQTFKDIEKPQTCEGYILWEKKTTKGAVKKMEKKSSIDIKNEK